MLTGPTGESAGIGSIYPRETFNLLLTLIGIAQIWRSVGRSILASAVSLFDRRSQARWPGDTRRRL
jgi:hypothetical protein